MSALELSQVLSDLEEELVRTPDGMVTNTMLMVELAKKDGPTAMEYAMNNKTDLESFVSMKHTVLDAWVRTDPKAASEWYDTHKDDTKLLCY